MILQPACMLIINYSCAFLLKFIIHIILFITTAQADTRGHEVTWQDNHTDAYSYSYMFAYYVKISTVYIRTYIVVRIYI